MKLTLFSKKGKKTEKKVNLDDTVFKSNINEYLLSRYVYVYLQNQRQSNANTKDRGEVSGGGKKPWRQKGTGRARHGSIRSPIFKGGGVTFGPTNERNYTKKLNKKERKQAIRSALSLKAKNKELIIIDNLDINKTQELEKLVKSLKLIGKVLFVQVEDKGLYLASRNLKNIDVVRVGELNAYDILNNKFLVILKGALDLINDIWKCEKNNVKKETKEEVKTKATKKK